MASFTQIVQKYSAYILVYQKEGSIELATKYTDAKKQQTTKEQNIHGIVAGMELRRQEEKDRRENPMFEFGTAAKEEEEKEKKAKGSQLKKRKPFIRIRDPLTQMVKMRVFCSKAPSKIEAEQDKTKKLNLKDLANRSTSVKAWSKDAADAVGELTALNKFMLGKVERKKDEYDVEYDRGKVKKVKKQKIASRINFDKQAKRNQKRESSGEKTFRKRK